MTQVVVCAALYQRIEPAWHCSSKQANYGKRNQFKGTDGVTIARTAQVNAVQAMVT